MEERDFEDFEELEELEVFDEYPWDKELDFNEDPRTEYLPEEDPFEDLESYEED